MVKKNEMVMVERNIYLWKMRWCKGLGTPEECRRDQDAGDMEKSGCDLCVGRKGRGCVWEERGKWKDGFEGVVRVFNAIPERNVLMGTTLINGFAAHGRTKEALRIFDEMKKAKLQLDYIISIGVLTACSHGGLLDERMRVFDSIRRDYGIEPSASIDNKTGS
ncbi:pentatricopeptide repeat-containing-like protein [Cinnamomum micranthum f. kanehirae]|uniref:Pentatricopeptide repeat-containing-like protein n=1 Tax=Cinnamomum micranthum f. kanehirae TaxID=337451 RepID=A0A3S3R6A9_9MAGN|nr:pentatricopeptide repeat-containing-like protein [Cinnamomum micranthum f. kanehirae]